MNTHKVHRAVIAYLATAATPVSLLVRKCLEEGRLADLVKIKVRPSDYNCAEAYLYDAQCVAFFSKREDLNAGIDTKQAAEQAWFEAEHRCAATNAFLLRVENGPHDRITLRFRDFLSKVKKRMSWWLGPLPNNLLGKFGPGVTLCCRGNLSTVPDKMTVIPSTTPRMLDYLHWWVESSWARALDARGLLYRGGQLNVDIQRFAVWSSVPKKATTDRSIEIGASLNVYHQLFVGKTMKRRFQARGWDLRFSPDLHKRVACAASISGDFATIDLKQASDSVSKVLVKLCSPAPWYQLWSDLRSPAIQMPDGRVIYLEKFSGMGNGFTFELESVLFMAICQVVLEDLGLPYQANSDVYVFGDDLIVPTSAARPVMNALRCLGFEINEDKTFIDGPFRESCGGDFFGGVAVRPFFPKEDPHEPQQYIAFANGLRRVANSHVDGFSGRPDFLRPWLRVLDAIPSDIRRCRGPEELGDIVIHDEEAKWVTRTRSCIRRLQVYRPLHRGRTNRQGGSVVGWNEFWPEVQLASRLLAVGDDSGVKPRGVIDGYKIGWVPWS